METYMEWFSKKFLPSFRAMIAQEMAYSGMTQQRIAERLYVTQSAVSQYLRSIRGKGSLEMDEWKPSAKELASLISSRHLEKEELMNLIILHSLKFAPHYPSWVVSSLKEGLRRLGYRL